MPLCHVKHSELAEEFHSHKGRVVFRGDNVRDEQGHLAVFSEQGTSASHIAAAKFLDALARFHGNDGEDSDAMGAYTQAEHAGEVTWSIYQGTAGLLTGKGSTYDPFAGCDSTCTATLLQDSVWEFLGKRVSKIGVRHLFCVILFKTVIERGIFSIKKLSC